MRQRLFDLQGRLISGLFPFPLFLTFSILTFLHAQIAVLQSLNIFQSITVFAKIKLSHHFF